MTRFLLVVAVLAAVTATAVVFASAIAEPLDTIHQTLSEASK